MQKIKLDPRTIQVLKNYATINPSVLFRPGNVLATVSPNKTIMAKAVLAQSFETTFAIYDVSRFLSVHSLFTDPELEIYDKFVTIKTDDKRVNYVFAEPTAVIAPPDKELKMPHVDAAFRLTNDAMADVMKALGVLRLPEIAVVGDGETIQVQAIDSKNPSGDVYSVTVGATDKTFRAIFKAENIKLLAGDYDVEITSKGISHFKSEDIEYFIAVEASSSFS